MKYHFMNIKYQGLVERIEDEVLTVSEKLSKYIGELTSIVSQCMYDVPEASLCLSSNDEVVHRVREVVATQKTETLKYVFVVGIGGSNLGTYAVYEALFGREDMLMRDRFPKLVFLETVSAKAIEALKRVLTDVRSVDEICVNVISKSGTTTETVANFEVLYAILQERFGERVRERVVVTTDEGSKLWEQAQVNDYAKLSLPKQVGGRYSVLSAVGLFPLALAGVNIDALRAGAVAMREQCLREDLSNNPAASSAMVTYAYWRKGIHIHNTFFFNPELEMLGKWYRQLMGESLGKEYDVNGIESHIGITPIVSIGSTDLHSMAQLYFGGPNDKLTNFVWAPQDDSVRIPEQEVFPGLVSGIAGKSFSEMMDAIRDGVQATYQRRGLPYIDIELVDISEQSLGEYLQFRMMEMMYLAKLLNVNAFDQPNVEEYKIETRKILG